MFRRFMWCALAAAMAIVLAPMGSRAADPKLLDLQRDVASLQEQVRQLKESQDRQLTALTVLVQQAPDTPTISAQDLYANANRDRGGKKYDLALQEYEQYLKWYGNTALAPNAQYYIGDIHSRQKDFEAAVHDFDTVLEKYSD